MATDPTTDYAEKVVKGEIIAGPHVRASCQRHLNDLENAHERGLFFDLERAEYALGFFPNVLRLSEGQFEGRPFKLHPAQQFIVGSLFGWINEDGKRRFRRAYIEQGKGNGKDIYINELVPTPSGFKRMGELVEGDELYDEKGNVCRVTQAHPIGYMSDCYQIEFSDGNRIIAGSTHLWQTTFGLVTTEEIADTMGSVSHIVLIEPEVNDLKARMTGNPRSITRYLGIDEVRRVPTVPTRCISVSSPSQMFLVGRSFIPTHNSPLAGGIGLYGLTVDREPGAQIYAAAAKMDQARILYDDAIKMYRQSPLLEARLTPSGVNPVFNLADLKTGSFFRPLGRDTGKTGSGLRPHFVLVDELHEHPNRDTLDMLERGFKFREQPLVFMITNSGSDRNSVCWEEHEHAVKVAHGEVEDDTTFSYVCALDEGDDPLEDPGCWVKANPLLGVTLTEKYMADVVAQAKAIPGKANAIRRLHFCQWTDAESAWIGRDTWEACEDPDMTLDEFEGQEAWVGLDLGATRDLTARTIVFRDGYTEEGLPKFAMFAHGFTPKDTLHARAREDRAPYDVWVEKGFLTAMPGKIVRMDYIVRDLVELSERFALVTVAYDRWLIRGLEQELDEGGITLPLMEHPQGTNRRQGVDLWMPNSIDKFEELLLEKRVRIAVNPALRSAVASATFYETSAGLRRFEKNRANSRIDMAVASAMAVGAATLHDAPKQERTYQMFFLG